MLFSELNLNPGILKALNVMQYNEATDIQSQVIKLALEGKNIVGQSQTGTGKTAAFLIPLLHKIDNTTRGIQALILAPTRELVNQIGEEINKLTKYHKVNAVCIYGGANPNTQKKKIFTGPQIIVATPGRLLDFIDQRVISLWKVNYLILDEVDRMLDMGFIRDIQKIRAEMHQIKQTLTFSATLSKEIKKIIQEHIPVYESIKIGEEVTVDKINHSFVDVAHDDKMFNLIKIIQEHKDDKIVVFTQTKRNTKTLYLAIEEFESSVYMLNGDMNQNKRNRTLSDFKNGNLRVLVTTDVAARGLNMDNVGLVINFDVPKEAESYIHRIGRTGRAGANGKAIMLVSPEEKELLADIEIKHDTKVQQSDYIAQVDEKRKFTHHRLDKSTDKFGKGRPNPNRGPRTSSGSNGGGNSFRGRSDSKSRFSNSSNSTGRSNNARRSSRGR